MKPKTRARRSHNIILTALGIGLVWGVLGVAGLRAATIVGDNYNVTGSGSGFALGSGANSGINPPTTRLSGTTAAGLRYINTGTKAVTAYTITGNKLNVTAAANPGRFVLSADGATPFDFSNALGIGAASPTNPVVYELRIKLNNNSTGTQRFSFALGTSEGDATTWDFGVQVYRAASGNNFYTIGKRIDTGSSGLAADLNQAIFTMTPYTDGTEIDLLMRVTDAGAQTTAFNSRVQLSLNGGNSWFYDTATDADLAGTGWRLNGPGRYIMWDVAPDAGPVTYDAFSLRTYSPPVSGPISNSVFRVMTYNIHSAVGSDNKVNTQRIADFILANDVDLVGLNEVSRFMPRGDGRDLIGELAIQTGMTAVFSNSNTGLTGNDQFGNAILSRYPVLAREHILLPNINGNEQRGLLKTVVDVNGKFISFWSTHLAFVADNTERLMCVTNFNTWVTDETLPTIICGDFNETPDKVVHDRMELKWRDIWLLAGSGLGRTSPCPGPVQTRIDFIWQAKTAPLTPTNPFVDYTIEASDHYPVITDFVLTNGVSHVDRFHFPLNQGSGTSVVDTVGGLTGKLTAPAPTWNTNSPSGQPNDFSLYFDGTKKLTVPDPAQIIGTNGMNDDYTLQAWVKLPLNLVPTERMVLFQYERRPGFSFSINTNRTLHTTAFKQKDIVSNATVPNDGQWHHVAVVHTDGANMKFYIDGVLGATVAYTNGAGFRASSALTIGTASEDSNWFIGNLDRISFENRALTPSQFDFPALANLDFPTWQTVYGLADANSDADGDGQNNFAEYQANTNPTNAASAFRILGANRQPDGRFNLSWTTVGAKRYRVQSSNGISGTFTDIVRDTAVETDFAAPGIAGTQTFIDDFAPTNQVRFYRVKIVP